jgi:hypothetical protein
MKQVIKNNASNCITVNEIQPNKYFVARSRGELFTLEFETTGFIFRPSDPLDPSGHSGYHRSPAEAIEKALTIGHTEIFQFDSIRELSAFIADNVKS